MPRNVFVSLGFNVRKISFLIYEGDVQILPMDTYTHGEHVIYSHAYNKGSTDKLHAAKLIVIVTSGNLCDMLLFCVVW